MLKNNHRNVTLSYKGLCLGNGVYLSNQLDLAFNHYITAKTSKNLVVFANTTYLDMTKISGNQLQYIQRHIRDDEVKLAIFFNEHQREQVEIILNKACSDIGEKFVYDLLLDPYRIFEHLKLMCSSFSHRKGDKSKAITGSRITVIDNYHFNDLVTIH